MIRECCGPFDLPEGIFLASPMFLIGSSQPVFNQNAYLSMEHFIDLSKVKTSNWFYLLVLAKHHLDVSLTLGV